MQVCLGSAVGSGVLSGDTGGGGCSSGGDISRRSGSRGSAAAIKRNS